MDPLSFYLDCLTIPLILVFGWLCLSLGGNTLLYLANRLSQRLTGESLREKGKRRLIWFWIVLSSALGVWLTFSLGK